MHHSNVVCVNLKVVSLKLIEYRIGNLGRVDYINDNEYDLFIRPDTCSPRFRSWFLFTVENVRADQVRNEFHVFFIRQTMPSYFPRPNIYF